MINATPIGLLDDAMPVDPGALAAHARVLDLVYRRGRHAVGKGVRARAARRADDGLRMLVEQGAAAFERWFGVSPDREVMWRALA